MPNNISASDPKPTMFSEKSRGSFTTSSLTYNEAGDTYNEAGVVYGGFGGELGEYPKIKGVVTL